MEGSNCHKFYNICYPNICMMVREKSLRQRCRRPGLKNQPSPLPVRIKQIRLTSCCVSQSVSHLQYSPHNTTQHKIYTFVFFLFSVTCSGRTCWPSGRKSTGTEWKVLRTRPHFHNQSAANTLNTTSKRGIINRNNKNIKIHRIFP